MTNNQLWEHLKHEHGYIAAKRPIAKSGKQIHHKLHHPVPPKHEHFWTAAEEP